MADTDKPVQRVLDAYAAAVFAKDVEALIRLYDRNVRVFDAWGLWLHEGAAAWQVSIEGWFASLGADRVRVRFDDVRTFSVSREGAAVSAIVRYASVSAQGDELRAMQNRLTWILETSGHVLRIVHEHTSAPVGFDDMKAILQRDGAA